MTHKNLAALDSHRAVISQRRQFAANDLLKLIGQWHAADLLDLDNRLATPVNQPGLAVNRDVNLGTGLWLWRWLGPCVLISRIFRFHIEYLFVET